MAKMRLNATTSKLRNIYAMADFADAYEQHTGEKRDEYLNRSVPTAIKLLDTTPPSDGLR